MKNKLTDLNDHLFAQMERLSADGLKGDELREEIERTDAITGVAQQIIANARVVLDAYKSREGLHHVRPPALLGLTDETGARGNGAHA